MFVKIDMVLINCIDSVRLRLMKKILPLIFLLFFNCSYAELIIDEWGEESFLDDIIIVSVNGHVTAGDRYRLFFRPLSEERCNQPDSYISFYSVVDDAVEKFNNLPSKYIVANINDDETFLASIEDSGEFIAGARALIFMGTISTENLIGYHKGKDQIKIQLIAFYDYEEKTYHPEKIDDYFDIPVNTSSLNGFEDAVTSAKNKCLASVG